MKSIQQLLVYSMVAVTTVAGCKSNSKEQTMQPTIASDSAVAFVLQKDTFNKEISFPGELLPLEKAEIYAKVSGYVKSIPVDIGDAVQKGQVIAVLDAPEMMATYAQAMADVQVARSKYAGSIDAYQRMLKAAKVEGTVAAGELERLKSQMQVDSASLHAAGSKLNVYNKLNDYLVVRAPFAGIITQRNIDPGTLVGATNARPMLIIEDNQHLRLRMAIPEAYTAAVPQDALVQFTVDAYPGVVYQAKLRRKAGALNLANRTETWEFEYANNNKQLKSGMYANAKLKFGRKAATFTVPVTTVVTNQEKRFVIRMRAGKAEWIDVRNGFAIGDRIEIFGDLAEGDTLLVRGTDEIKPGKSLSLKF